MAFEAGKRNGRGFWILCAFWLVKHVRKTQALVLVEYCIPFLFVWAIFCNFTWMICICRKMGYTLASPKYNGSRCLGLHVDLSEHLISLNPLVNHHVWKMPEDNQWIGRVIRRMNWLGNWMRSGVRNPKRHKVWFFCNLKNIFGALLGSEVPAVYS